MLCQLFSYVRPDAPVKRIKRGPARRTRTNTGRPDRLTTRMSFVRRRRMALTRGPCNLHSTVTLQCQSKAHLQWQQHQSARPAILSSAYSTQQAQIAGKGPLQHTQHKWCQCIHSLTNTGSIAMDRSKRRYGRYYCRQPMPVTALSHGLHAM